MAIVFLVEAAGAILLWLFFDGQQRLFNSVFFPCPPFAMPVLLRGGTVSEQFRTNYAMNIVIMALYSFGRPGLYVLDELLQEGRQPAFHKDAPPLSFYSRLVLGVTCWLVLGGAAILFLLGCLNPGFASFPWATGSAARF